jgi:hypothetical protein
VRRTTTRFASLDPADWVVAEGPSLFTDGGTDPDRLTGTFTLLRADVDENLAVFSAPSGDLFEVSLTGLFKSALYASTNTEPYDRGGDFGRRVESWMRARVFRRNRFRWEDASLSDVRLVSMVPGRIVWARAADREDPRR